MTDNAQEKDPPVVVWVEKQGVAQTQRNVLWRWIAWIGIAAVALGGVIVLYYKMWSKSRELAKLKHERDIAAENQIKAGVDAKVADELKGFREARADAAQATEDIRKLEEKINGAEIERLKLEGDIDALRSWDDVDRYLARKPEDPPR